MFCERTTISGLIWRKNAFQTPLTHSFSLSPPSHTHTIALSLSLTHTTHTHSLSLSLTPSVVLGTNWSLWNNDTYKLTWSIRKLYYKCIKKNPFARTGIWTWRPLGLMPNMLYPVNYLWWCSIRIVFHFQNSFYFLYRKLCTHFLLSFYY